jgi:crotonobetainyl-CoA:carnitine CoA-transferase CaiB-like acyl-CoA transferase
MPVMRENDMYAAPVQGFEQAFNDPQVKHNEMIVTIESPIGPIKLIAPAFTLTKTPASIRTPPPLHGQHTNQILTELGYTDGLPGGTG